MAQISKALGKRPGMVTFAAIMMFLLGGFELAWAFTELGNASWLASTAYGTFGNYLWIWAILDILCALCAFYAGYDILRGGQFGMVFAVIIAGFSAIRWFFLLPVLPLAAVIILLLDALILYGLLGHVEYFGVSSRP